MSTIKIINSSCVDQEVDAIVNAANKNLISGGGVCGAIFNKAGYEKLNQACQKINTPLEDGQAVITPAFNIRNAKYIIHAVGPDFSKTNDINKLYNAYYNSLKLLKYNNIHSISFPLISSGIFGYNLDNAAYVSAKECIKAYNNFTKNDNYEINVLLCAYSKDEYEEIKSLIK